MFIYKVDETSLLWQFLNYYSVKDRYLKKKENKKQNNMYKRDSIFFSIVVFMQ